MSIAKVSTEGVVVVNAGTNIATIMAIKAAKAPLIIAPRTRGRERPSKVATIRISGWESHRARPSQPPVASLGAQLATAVFKRRQAK